MALDKASAGDPRVVRIQRLLTPFVRPDCFALRDFDFLVSIVLPSPSEIATWAWLGRPLLAADTEFGASTPTLSWAARMSASGRMSIVGYSALVDGRNGVSQREAKQWEVPEVARDWPLCGGASGRAR